MCLSFCGSCLGSCAGSCCCSACNRICGSKGSFTPYIILTLLNTILAIIMRYEGGPLVLSFYSFNTQLCSESVCAGMDGVFRISFALFLFYFLHGFLLMFKPFTKLDHISWIWKYLIYIILLIIAFTIPQPFYHDGYIHISRIISGIFLFLQVVILIDFAYAWNEKWTGEENPKLSAVLSISGLFYCGCIVLWVFYFIWFGGSTCPRNQFFISWTIIGSVLMTGLSISPVVEKGGLLPAAVISLYCTWLCYSGLESDPSSCNTLATGSQDTLHLILGLSIGAVSIAYAGWNVATSNSLFGGAEMKPKEIDNSNENEKSNDSKDEKLSSIAISEGGAGSGAKSSKKSDKEDNYGSNGDADNKSDRISESDLETEEDIINNELIAKRNMRFHYIMAACSCYMAMLLTNWGSLSSHQSRYDASEESMFIKFATQWLTMLLFVWTLLAPIIFKDRDFN